MMTNGDPEGQIFLSYPHTTNGFFFLLTGVPEAFIMPSCLFGFFELTANILILYLLGNPSLRWAHMPFCCFCCAGDINVINLLPAENFFVLKMSSALTSAAYNQVHLRLDFFMKANNMSPDHNSPLGTWVYIIMNIGNIRT